MNFRKSLLVLTCILLLACDYSVAQSDTNSSGKIEFYLLKHVIPSANKNSRLMGRFEVTKTDLEEKAFIADADIISCTIKGDTTR